MVLFGGQNEKNKEKTGQLPNKYIHFIELATDELFHSLLVQQPVVTGCSRQAGRQTDRQTDGLMVHIIQFGQHLPLFHEKIHTTEGYIYYPFFTGTSLEVDQAIFHLYVTLTTSDALP